MLLEFAPMEGITTSAYRRLHHELFPGVDRYYTPFLSPTRDHKLTARDKREILPEQNEGLCVVPQLLTKSAEDFLWAAGELHAMGYEEVNLNAGCPSGTVTAKGKGSGLLSDLESFRRFLDDIFEKAPCRVSIKTRLGLREPEEFEPILELYNQYPICCLTVHPRVRQDLYRHAVRREWFDYAAAHSKNPLSYNGGVETPGDAAALEVRWPNLRALMIGQALVVDPAFAARCRGGAGAGRAQLRTFHDRLFETYEVQFESRRNAVMRMKELWAYEIRLFQDGEKLAKRIFKSKTPEEYQAAVTAVFTQLALKEEMP